MDKLILNFDVHSKDSLFHLKGIQFAWSNTVSGEEFLCTSGDYQAQDFTLDAGSNKVDGIMVKKGNGFMRGIAIKLSDGSWTTIFGDPDENNEHTFVDEFSEFPSTV